MKTSWPTATDLTNCLSGLGVTLPSGIAAADLVAASVQAWESATGVSPWLASATASTRRFDAPQSGHLPIVAAAVTQVEVDAEDLTGTTLTENEDYWLQPEHASSQFRPVRIIRFANRLQGWPNSVRVTANWGYQLQIFEEAWLAVLNYAVGQAVEAVAMKQALASGGYGPVTMMKQADVSVSFGVNLTFPDRQRAEWDRLVAKHRMRSF